MSTYNNYFHGELRKIFCGYPSYLELWFQLSDIGAYQYQVMLCFQIGDCLRLLKY